jgi:hypothetical protein
VGETSELSSILKKLDEVEKDSAGDEGNTVKLFKKLNEKEKELLEKFGFLQKDKDGKAWAISYPAYRKLKSRNVKRILQST